MIKLFRQSNGICSIDLSILILCLIVTMSVCSCGKKDVTPDNVSYTKEGKSYTFNIPQNIENEVALKISVSDKEGNGVATYEYADYNEFDYEVFMPYRYGFSAYEPVQGCILDESFGCLLRKREVMPDTGLVSITYYEYSQPKGGDLMKKVECSDSYNVQNYSEYEYNRGKKIENTYSATGELIAKTEYNILSDQMVNYETYNEDGSVKDGYTYRYIDDLKDSNVSSYKHYTADGELISERDEYSYGCISMDDFWGTYTTESGQPLNETLALPYEQRLEEGHRYFDIMDEDYQFIGYDFAAIEVWYNYLYDESGKMFNGKNMLLRAERRGTYEGELINDYRQNPLENIMANEANRSIDEESLLATFEYEYDDNNRLTKIVYSENTEGGLYYEYEFEYLKK